ncbi:hypothetical protein ARMGADRAFT_1039243 [Armillaria gallica]|uniref:Endonuclease/exonuclease/phosphatase domain-containing protein n=1 Tax=Armillaria gallica TaxID=47427 RepID=A0A2H3CER7_ARMGA|nr:hypothetical protein ARMGADRAFT_1039243 [Armillaria gallica]
MSTLRIATYSLRYDSQPDQITVSESISALGNPLAQGTFLGLSGEQPWSTRRLRVAECLMNDNIVIAGFREALIGVVHSDREKGREYCPLFCENLYFTEMLPSRRPNNLEQALSDCVRHASFSLRTGAKTTYTATSWGIVDPGESTVQSRGPLFIMGDFNSPSTSQSSGAYDIFTGASAPVDICCKTGFDKPSDTSVWKRVDLSLEEVTLGGCRRLTKLGIHYRVMELWRAIIALCSQM